MKYLRIVGWVIGGVVALGAILALVSWLRFGPLGLFKPELVTMTLPFDADHEPTGVNPLGERENVHPGGHPGIDFGWEHSAPLIATFGGTITTVSRAKDEGAPVWYVTLKHGEYASVYKELELLGPQIKRGARVAQGDLIGYPHGSRHGTDPIHYQLHWEFGYASFPGFTRLCPLPYLDPPSLARITAVWEALKPQHDNPTGQELCNGEFASKDR